MLVRHCSVLIHVTVFWLMTHSFGRLDAAEPDFEKDIAPLFAAKCLECHSGTEPEGALNLATQIGVKNGGESGVAVQAGKPDVSLFWQRIRDDEMPPKHPLTANEKETLKNWITSGAKWSGGDIDRLQYTSDSRAGYDWWSLQPVRDVAP
ncbi:MAG: hypothetical protein ACI93T_004694, partial [Porticoccaceae bacterium]